MKILHMYKSVFYICLFAFISIGCQTEKPAEDNKNNDEATETKIIQDNTASSDIKELRCFQKVEGDMTKTLTVYTNSERLDGELSMTSKENDDFLGVLSGNIREEDIVADLTYTIDGKPYLEKVIINIYAENLSLARSGQMMVDKVLQTRNEGVATMDVFSRIDCK